MVIDMDTLISSADLLSTSLALYSSFYFLDVQDRSSHLLQKQFYALFHTGIKDNKKKDYHNSHFAKQKQKECLGSLKELEPCGLLRALLSILSGITNLTISTLFF